MASTRTPELNESADGLPRRRAIQGIAGSLAGIAALGAVNASAKKNEKKKSKKGTLARFETAEQTQSIPTATATTVKATCPAAGKKEQVFATGGGYEPAQSVLNMFAVASKATSNGDGWEATFNYAGVPQDATVSVVCAYFKTK